MLALKADSEALLLSDDNHKTVGLDKKDWGEYYGLKNFRVFSLPTQMPMILQKPSCLLNPGAENEF